MHRSQFYFAVAVLLLLAGVSAKLLAQDQKSPNQEERARAVNLVRLINTAENWYNVGTNTEAGVIEAHGRYASWDELNNSGVLKTVQGLLPMAKTLQVSASPEVMQGYRLDFLVSADGKSYSCLLYTSPSPRDS